MYEVTVSISTLEEDRHIVISQKLLVREDLLRKMLPTNDTRQNWTAQDVSRAFTEVYQELTDALESMEGGE